MIDRVQHGDPSEVARPTAPTDRYADRRQAGRTLAAVLQGRGFGATVVLGVPRGGMEVASEVARGLDAPLDVVVTRTVSLVDQPDVAAGAVAEGLASPVLQAPEGATPDDPEDLDAAVRQAQAEVAALVRRYRGTELPDLHDRTAIVVDDGAASGATAHAALLAVGQRRPARLLLALPVGARDAVERLGTLAEVVCLTTPRTFGSVADWYQQFDQVDDETVLDLLGRRR